VTNFGLDVTHSIVTVHRYNQELFLKANFITILGIIGEMFDFKGIKATLPNLLVQSQEERDPFVYFAHSLPSSCS
jgi:hypothetical protein